MNRCLIDHESTVLYRLSLDLVTSVLRAKVDSLTDPETGIFGPLESITLGTRKEVEVPTEVKAEGSLQESQEVKEVKDTSATSQFPTVSRGLAREGLGDGQGVSLEIQLGKFLLLLTFNQES